jgi:hypothetical protein
LRISTFTDCPESYDPSLRLHQRVLREDPIWHGTLRFSPRGYLYLSQRADVRAHFTKTIQLGCMLLEQIGHEPYYDWSIVELRLLRSQAKSAQEESATD